MNKQEKELARLELRGEAAVLKEMKGHYEIALSRINERIESLAERDDIPGIRQRRFQEALAEQVGGILSELRSGSLSTMESYLSECYEQGFLGSLYSLQKQGIPLVFPIDQGSVIKAVSMTAGDVKLSKRVYSNVDALQKQVIAEITRGFADASSATSIARRITGEADIEASIKRNVSGRANQALRRAMTIARTEKGRVRASSTLDAMGKAKDKGADVVKQWDSTMDSRTRPDHVAADGQIRELDEDFSVGGRRCKSPHMTGRPEHDINCRCVCLQRARAALEMPEGLEHTKWDGVNQCFADLSDAKSYEDFKARYEVACSGALVLRSGGTSGAYNDINDPYMEKREAHARLYYEEVRKRDRHAEAMAVSVSSGVAIDDVKKAYDHLFVNEHDLVGGYIRFDPYYEIAESWRRLREGKNVAAHDVTLLRHEAYEYDLMQKGLPYEEAHAAAEKMYNYAQELKDYKLSGGV